MRLSALGLIVLLLTGCGSVSKQASKNTAAEVHYDYSSRSAQGLIDDEKTELAILNAIHKNPALRDKGHINITAYNGWVLLSGEVPDKKVGFALASLARDTDKVRRVFNHLAIRAPSSLTERSHDTWLTTKVKARLLGDDVAQGTGTKVITERKTVYLMGLASRQQAEQRVKIAQQTDGVTSIINLMQYTR